MQIIPTPLEAARPTLLAPPLQTVPIGEKLNYQISWWGVPVGIVSLSTEQKGPLLKMECIGRSNRYLDAFYPVHIEMRSLVDLKAQSPRRFEAKVKRRFRNHESTILFDPGKGTAFHRLPKNRTATVSISPSTQDGLSLLYHVRTLEFQLGKRLPLEVTADGKNWRLTGRIVRMGRVKLGRLGTFQAVEGDVELAYPVPFFQGAKAWIWFSADERRIPLYARIHSRIGPVTITLVKTGTSSKGTP